MLLIIKNIYCRFFFKNGFYPAREVLFADDLKLQMIFSKFPEARCPLYVFFHENIDASLVSLAGISENSARMAPFIFSQLARFDNVYIKAVLEVAKRAVANNSLKSIDFSWTHPKGEGCFSHSPDLDGYVYINSISLYVKYRDDLVQGLMATLVHELSHAAMFFVFSNDCKPYLADDYKSAFEFEHAFTMCFSRSSLWDEKEAVILNAIKNKYESSRHHSEMVAGFAELLALGMTQERAKEIMPEMLIFWENRIFPALTRFYQDVPSVVL